MSAGSAEMMQRIAAAARAGRLDEAALLVERARAEGVNDPALAALGGAVEFHRGQFARAAPLLRDALAQFPADITIRGNLAESLWRSGDSTAAMALCDDATVDRDRSLRIAGLGAHLAQELGDHARAIALYRKIVVVRGDDWSIWNNLGNALSAQGEFEEAAIALERAAKLAPDSAPIQLNFGNALLEAGRPDEAERVLRAAAEQFADDPNPLLSMFSMFRAVGREDEAYEAIREAASRAPQSAPIQSDFGQEAARRNDYAVAEEAFESALSLQPGLGPAIVGLASVYERMNREDELDPLRERAIAQKTDAESLSYVDALRFKRAGRIDEAFTALEQAGDVVVAGRKHHLRGIMLDRLGRHDEAFAAFTAMNDHWKDDPSQPVERARIYREMTADAAALLDAQWAGHPSSALPPATYRAPIFLMGFPRSGTTLLDTMLMADPRVRVLEEEPFIGMAEHEMGGMAAFPDIPADRVAEARTSYFERVEAKVGPLDGAIVIDKHPLHLNKVAVILRLFPDARFVLALRHPCDVVLSCFLTNFRINNAMANFLDLNDAAALYDLSFSHWEKARDLLNPAYRAVVYERLVEDAERELRPLFDWLGLDWPEGKFDHREAARARGTVATASYSQVTEPIYKRAAGRWSRYASHLAPVIPVLAPWVERFGYSLDDGRFEPWSDVADQAVVTS